MSITTTTERPKGYRYPLVIISYAVYLYHRFILSYRDVQELLFERGIDVSHETVRAWCFRSGPDLAESLRQRKRRRGRTWHLDEMRTRYEREGPLVVASGQRTRGGIRCAAAEAA